MTDILSAVVGISIEYEDSAREINELITKLERVKRLTEEINLPKDINFDEPKEKKIDLLDDTKDVIVAESETTRKKVINNLDDIIKEQSKKTNVKVSNVGDQLGEQLGEVFEMLGNEISRLNVSVDKLYTLLPSHIIYNMASESELMTKFKSITDNIDIIAPAIRKVSEDFAAGRDIDEIQKVIEEVLQEAAEAGIGYLMNQNYQQAADIAKRIDMLLSGSTRTDVLANVFDSLLKAIAPEHARTAAFFVGDEMQQHYKANTDYASFSLQESYGRFKTLGAGVKGEKDTLYEMFGAGKIFSMERKSEDEWKKFIEDEFKKMMKKDNYKGGIDDYIKEKIDFRLKTVYPKGLSDYLKTTFGGETTMAYPDLTLSYEKGTDIKKMAKDLGVEYESLKSLLEVYKPVIDAQQGRDVIGLLVEFKEKFGREAEKDTEKFATIPGFAVGVYDKYKDIEAVTKKYMDYEYYLGYLKMPFKQKSMDEERIRELNEKLEEIMNNVDRSDQKVIEKLEEIRQTLNSFGVKNVLSEVQRGGN